MADVFVRESPDYPAVGCYDLETRKVCAFGHYLPPASMWERSGCWDPPSSDGVLTEDFSTVDGIKVGSLCVSSYCATCSHQYDRLRLVVVAALADAGVKPSDLPDHAFHDGRSAAMCSRDLSIAEQRAELREKGL